MVRKLLVIALGLVLVFIAVAPAVSAKDSPATNPVIKRFKVEMVPNAIEPAVVSEALWPTPNPPQANSWPIVDLVNGVPSIVGWVVDGRSITGGTTGNITGQFTFTYGGIVDTLQSGSIHGIVTLQSAQGIIYLAARGELDTTIKNYYTFAEISAWWLVARPQPPQPELPLWVFFVNVYNNQALVGLPDAALAAAYGTMLPPLPKTLSAEFSGTARIDAGTGVYGAVFGQATFKPAQHKPLTLSVYPNQHGYAIQGAIELNGYYSAKPLRQPLKIDKEKLSDFLKKWQGHRD